ncbi:RNA recognition motif containing protein [Musa troglodytarum]|uniref:RNA recognition motif containing protein n=1 Tax=Musa troglodytarum TaxID=320322 RepID=A0A9E7II65_9LILI|nr:RNA recognition motif containing protein [Musa troglodytarum]
MWQLNPSTRKRERRSWLFEIEIMAVVESTSGVDLAATGSPLTGGGVAPDPRSPKGLVSASDAAGLSVLRSHPDASDAFHAKLLRAQDPTRDGSSSASAAAPRPNGVAPGGEGFKREMRDLVELLSKLNPMAEEFVPPSLAGMGNSYGAAAGGSGEFYASDSGMSDGVGNGGAVGIGGRRKKNGYGHGKRRMNSRTSLAQRDEVIRRTVYVSDIDHQVPPPLLLGLLLVLLQVLFPLLSFLPSPSTLPILLFLFLFLFVLRSFTFPFPSASSLDPPFSFSSSFPLLCPLFLVTEEQLATLFINCGPV